MVGSQSRRRRADALLAERGLVPSRSAAAASIRAGMVRVGSDGPSAQKPSQLLPAAVELVAPEDERACLLDGLAMPPRARFTPKGYG